MKIEDLSVIMSFVKTKRLDKIICIGSNLPAFLKRCRVFYFDRALAIVEVMLVQSKVYEPKY